MMDKRLKWTLTCGLLLSLAGCGTGPNNANESLAHNSAALSCGSAGLATLPGSPQAPGTMVTLNATSQTCGTPQYEFWVFPPNGSWTMVQSYSNSPTYGWDTTGLSAGSYNLEVWVKDSGSTENYDSYAEVSFDITGALSPNCSGATLTAMPADAAIAGTPVTMTAGSNACDSAQYQYWVRPPGGSWTILQAYSSSASYQWDTIAAVPGTYYLEVWVKSASSAETYDSYAVLQYDIHQDCQSATLSTSLSSPQAAGTSVTFNAGTASCGSPQYEFWVYPPGGPWSIVQAYGGSSSYVWDTTGLAAGSYNVEVWAKDSASASSYTTYHVMSFDITASTAGPSCDAATLSASPPEPQPAGTMVTLNAGASTCMTPQYEFWVYPPGGPWNKVRDYSSSASYQWDTIGLAPGVYNLEMWAKDATSIAAYDTYHVISFTVQ